MAEAVAALGLVLGVLPLIVSAIENYENVCRPIGHYRNFAAESIKLQKKLGTERAIFVAECKLLLQKASSTSRAGEMVADVKSDAWKDKELDEMLTEYIADYHGQFINVVEDIREHVREIEAICQVYGVLDSGAQITLSSHGHWRLRGSKLKYSLIGATRLEEKLRELEDLTRLFVLLSGQIKESIQLSTAQQLPGRANRLDVTKNFEYQTVQEASKELYEALGQACDCHEEHSLHVRLDTQHSSKHSQIRFNLGLRSADNQSPIWIVIESMSKSIPVEKRQCRTASTNLPALFGFQDTQQPSIHVQKVSRVRIQQSSRWTKDVELVSSSDPSKQSDPSHLDLPIRRKICDQLRQHVNEDMSSFEDERCLGFLEADSKYRHLLYFTPEQLSSPKSNPVSLSHVMSPIFRSSPLGDLNLYEKFRLARQLSTAVLHFHPTPIMKAPWQSEDVIFFGNDFTSTQRRPCIASPHLKVQIRNKHHVTSQDGNTDEETFSPRNPHLFALALLLFQIGYQTSIQGLHDQFKSAGTPSDKQRDYNLVHKVCKNFMSAKTGVPYKIIVYKCLNCDFGTGEDDLSSAVLQRAFYEHVVCALEQLEREQEETYGANLC